LIMPPAVYKDILITGGSNGELEPSTGLYGDIRGWDARTGKLLWSFHTVPRSGEPASRRGRARAGRTAWNQRGSYLTIDVERGLVFAPTGSPTSDFYGADRTGKNLYANCLIALDAATGRLRWFQQLVHHDIWDFDLPAAPTLIEVSRNGRRIPAVAQITKMSTLFIFDRVTGDPLFGMEERAVPQSDVPGEATWPTQPFPRQPPPLSRTTFDPEKDLYALTPEHAAYCRDLWTTNKMFTTSMFTPPRTDATMVMFPSTLGGGNWSGLSYDPARGLVFTNVMNLDRSPDDRCTDPATGAVRRAHLAVGGRMGDSGTRRRKFRVRRAVRRTGGGRRQPRGDCVACAARRVRRSDRARDCENRHAQHRRHHRHRRRPPLHRRHDRQALPRP
jgi:quinoprotein glucose dehydrogenase